MTHLDQSSSPRPLIAVVDDHQPTRTTICRLLERQGYATCNFGSVAEFIRFNEKRKIACLVSDVRMPEIDGVFLHECLRQTNFVFPVIFCTGHDLDDRLEQAIANGAYGLLRKPVKSEALLQAVAAACNIGKRP